MTKSILTEEQKAYLLRIAPNRFNKEITLLINNKFKTNFTENQIKHYKKHNKIKSFNDDKLKEIKSIQVAKYRKENGGSCRGCIFNKLVYKDGDYDDFEWTDENDKNDDNLTFCELFFDIGPLNWDLEEFSNKIHEDKKNKYSGVFMLVRLNKDMIYDLKAIRSIQIINNSIILIGICVNSDSDNELIKYVHISSELENVNFIYDLIWREINYSLVHYKQILDLYNLIKTYGQVKEG